MISDMCYISVDKYSIYCGGGVVAFQRFDPVGYGVLACECYLDICVSEYVCDLVYLWENIGECYSSPVFVCACVHCGVLSFLFYLLS